MNLHAVIDYLILKRFMEIVLYDDTFSAETYCRYRDLQASAWEKLTLDERNFIQTRKRELATVEGEKLT